MFRAPLCPSSGAQEYYTVVVACDISCCGFQVVVLMWSWGLCVRFAGCCSILQTGHITLSSTLDQQLENHSTKYHRQQPPYNTLELLMMGIVVYETCWASNKICNKKTFVAFSWHFGINFISEKLQLFPCLTEMQVPLLLNIGNASCWCRTGYTVPSLVFRRGNSVLWSLRLCAAVSKVATRRHYNRKLTASNYQCLSVLCNKHFIVFVNLWCNSL